MKKAGILVVDDDPDVLTAVKLMLKTEVRLVQTSRHPEELPALLSSSGIDLILLDMNFHSSIHTGNEGLFWLRKIKSLRSEVCVVMITAYGDIDLAVQCLKDGASDFIVKPWDNERMLSTIKETLRSKGNPSFVKNNISSDDQIIGKELIGESDVMQDIFLKIKKVAPTDANILILGENGTGKDLIARAIHQHSLRAGKPYIKVDVGSLTESLFESELFGHEKGAFTDARDQRAGRFELGNGGTLFLDEIGNIKLHQQARLLTALQNRHISRLGSSQQIPIDIRLICATNLPIHELADEKKFRKDLIYRINTVEILVPPLRDRGKDVELLANHFCRQYAIKYLKGNISISPAAMEKLKRHHFPGNVRELQYAMERAVIMAESEVLGADDILFSPIEQSSPGTPAESPMNLNEMEKQTILQAIDKHRGNITKAAEELGLTRTALYRRMNKYGI